MFPVNIVLIPLLFLSLLTTFLFLIVPEKTHRTSPALVALDALKRTLGGRFETESKKKKIAMLSKDLKELFNASIALGLGLAFLLGIFTYIFVPILVPIAIVLGFGIGVILVDIGIDTEYKRFQSQMAQGTLPLASFMPAFLEAEGVTPREALMFTLPFIPTPLHEELRLAVSRIARTGRVTEAMESLTSKVDNPIVDAICFRLATAWDAKVTADIFDDLNDQLEIMKELAISSETTAKTGFLALIAVLGLIGVLLVFGYPGIQYLAQQMSIFY